MRRVLLAAAVLAAGITVPAVAKQAETPTIKAGYGQADATWDVGASAGQYAGRSGLQNGLTGGDVDPHAHATVREASYGVHSRLTARAIVVQGTDGRQVALLKTDNYLAQDLLLRRVGQLLDAAGSTIEYDEILHSATHNHSSPYYTTTSPGVWVFQDVFDQRMFEYQARAVRDAILAAERDLQPARMAATTVEHTIFKGNVVGPATADDETPAGYPRDFGDDGLVVVRFDALHPAGKSGRTKPGAPIASYVNFGQHPESLDGYGLITADYLGPLERIVERETGAPVVFSQADVGSAEGPSGWGTDVLPDGTPRRFQHEGYAQMERGAKLLGDDVVRAFSQAATDEAQVRWSSSFPVAIDSEWVPGPVSHPYPSVGNCRTDPTLTGNPGAPTTPDCQRAQDRPDTFALHGLPVPDHYDAPGYPAVEENTRIRLQVARLGEVLLASCACEAQVDLIKNLETRTNDRTGDMWLGYDWSGECEKNAAGYRCRGKQVTADAYERMRAQVFNDAKGWDDPEYAAEANDEPADPKDIKGNFTHEELPPQLGYALPVGLGHSGDYVGYTVSYREYMSRESYRKALTSYGPHTADYMVTRLVRMAGALKGGPALAAEVNDAQAQADEQRQAALAAVIGQESGRAYDAFLASLPDDLGPAGVALAQPSTTPVQRFSTATFSWRGGTTAVDNPVVRVERQVDGRWQPFADMSGEVQTLVRFPKGVQGVVDSRTGRHEWRWTAGFEAFTGSTGFGSTPVGTYRFVVDGASRAGGTTKPYRVASAPFDVVPADRLTVAPVKDAPGAFELRYPRTAASPFRTIKDDGRSPICRTCSFRPWAWEMTSGTVTVTVTRASGAVEQVPATYADGRWSVPLQAGDRAVVAPGGAVDEAGNTNGTALVVSP